MKTAIEVDTALGVRRLLTSFSAMDSDFQGKPLTDAIVMCVKKIGLDQPGSAESELHKAMLQSLLTAAIVDRIPSKS